MIRHVPATALLAVLSLGTAGATTDAATAESLGDVQWFTLFQDQALQKLIRSGLERNLDVRIAAARVAQAQAQAGGSRAEQFPSLTAAGAASRQQSVNPQPYPNSVGNSSQFGLSSVWQLDFWGRYRKATEAARAELAATEWGRKAVIASLVSNLASAYFQLRELDLELDISRRTVSARRKSLELTKAMEHNGAATMLDVRQAEKLVEAAARTIPDLEKRIAQQENLISILMGSNPGPIRRGQALLDTPLPPAVPEGLPSALLERRPDIRQAEQRLIAANARVGVAKSMYFPALSLTGAGGFQAYSMTGLFDSKVYAAGTSMTAPVFDFGRIRSGVRLSEAQKQEIVLTYRQTVQQAFREVSDALVALQKNREYRERQHALTGSAAEAAKLADIRFKGGASSYLEVLTSQTDLFDAELGLAQAELNERLAVVQVYTSLGGGWQN
jgi:multidrug efflux system outer membrane protein